jgi:hypothetical protein
MKNEIEYKQIDYLIIKEIYLYILNEIYEYGKISGKEISFIRY